jgi:predicted ABC-type transport system involved in lysophospholipase L1 biosynthesis ATPase subunit
MLVHSWWDDTMGAMIELTHVSKTYHQGDSVISVLKDVTLSIKEGERVAIVGASGSGKSTLLSLMSGMDTPDSGSIKIDGQELGSLSEADLSHLRNKTIAIIFQSFELVPSFSALENVMLPIDIRRENGRTKAEQALADVGLEHRMEHLPSMLSGGEEQRVAIARALVGDPKIIFADEPTGNLDRTTGEQVLSLITRAANNSTKTLVMITHDREIAKRMDRVLEIRDGQVHSLSL